MRKLHQVPLRQHVAAGIDLKMVSPAAAASAEAQLRVMVCSNGRQSLIKRGSGRKHQCMHSKAELLQYMTHFLLQPAFWDTNACHLSVAATPVPEAHVAFTCESDCGEPCMRGPVGLPPPCPPGTLPLRGGCCRPCCPVI